MKVHLLLHISKPQKQKFLSNRSTAGFTVVEVLIVAIMVGVLSVISGAGYLAWLDRLRVNAARDVALNAIRDAQNAARRMNSTWQASFREHSGRIQWAVHSADDEGNKIVWQTVEQIGVKIDIANTTLYKKNTNGFWRVQFNYKGHTNGQLGRLTLSNFNGGNKRCVFVSTLLGAVRTDRERDCERR